MKGSRATALAIGLFAVLSATVAVGYAYPETLTSTEPGPVSYSGFSERTLVCPVLAEVPDGAQAVTVFSAADQSADQVAGRIVGAATTDLPLPAPGAATTVTAVPPGGSVEVVAEGASAAGTATVRSYLDTADEGRGLALATCPQPRAEWWFVGVSAVLGQIDELLLANPTASPAVVNIEVFGSTGPVDVLGVGGLVVQPGAQTAIRVDSLIPGMADATLRVRTTGGLVAATVRSTAIDGLIPQGAEFLPPATAPAVSLVVPGVLAGPGTRSLVVTADEQDAAVDVTLLTADGPRKRDGGGLIPVPAGTTVAVDLADDTDGEAVALALESTAPVTAAVRSVLPGTLAPDATGVLNRVPSADMAWTAAQPVISERWLLPLTGVAEAPGGVLLSSAGGAVEVEVSVTSANGASWQQTVPVPADSIREVAVPITAGETALVTLAVSGEGQLHAASWQSGSLPNGPIATAANGADPSVAVLLPSVYPDLQVLS